jgi:hypothetical protein
MTPHTTGQLRVNVVDADSSVPHAMLGLPGWSSLLAAWLGALAGQWSLLTGDATNIAIFAATLIGLGWLGVFTKIAIANQWLLVLMTSTAAVRLSALDDAAVDAVGCVVLGDWLLVMTCRVRESRWQDNLKLSALGMGVLASAAITPPVWLQAALLTTLIIALIAGEDVRRFRASGSSSTGIAVLAVLVVGTWLGTRWLLSDSTAIGARAGILPSSGGSIRFDPRATGGLGEGEDEANSPFPDASIGFDESNNFMESGLDSLYDLFTESFGEPVPREHQRMLALKQQDVNVVTGREEFDGRSGRRFELRRKPAPREHAPPPCVDELLFVSGRGPLRLRLQCFDDYIDGEWVSSRPGMIQASLYVDDYRATNRNAWWTMVDQADSVAARGSHETRIRIVNYKGNALPLPPITRHFCLGRVDRLDFFAELPGGTIALRHRDIPRGSTLMALSERIDSRSLRDRELMRVSARLGKSRDLQNLPESVRQLVLDWIAGRPAGWQQVHAVLDGLKRHAALDRNIDSSQSSDPLVDFLLVRRRGNSHDFASAAAIILAELGYMTRFAVGLYVNPASHDSQHDQTPVRTSDLHCWPEIRLSSMLWVPLEATPGHELEQPAPTILQRLEPHWRWLAAVTVFGATLFLVRNRLVDAWLLLLLCWQRRAGADSELRATARLLDHRLNAHRMPRPPRLSLAEHLAAVGRQIGMPCVTLLRFTETLERWQFGPRPATVQTPDPETWRAVREAPSWFSHRRLVSLRDRSRESRD